MSFFHDNAAPHATQTRELIFSLILPTALTCFFLFPKIKKELKNKKYNKVEYLAQAVQVMTSSILKEEYHRSFEDWQRIRMLAEIVFEKINFGKQFWIHNIFHIKDHQKTT